jgi:hypothetical protein
MVPLGVDMGDEGGGSRSRARTPSRPTEQSPRPDAPQSTEKAPNPLEDATDAVNKLKGLLKF